MDLNTEKQLVLEALATGKYEASYEPVNTICECTKYDGSQFYVMEDLDGPRSSEDLGTFTVEVMGTECHEFIYSMGGGDWYGDDFCDDEEVIDALENLPDFIYYEDYDGDRQWEVYSKVYGIDKDAEFFWCEDDDCPKDVEELGDEDIEIPLQYYLAEDSDTCSDCFDMECEMTDGDLYHIYQLAVKTGKLDDSVEFFVKGNELLRTLPSLYKEIKEQIMEQAVDICGEQCERLEFKLQLSQEIFEENL